MKNAPATWPKNLTAMGDRVLEPGATIGILGGGQLGRMLASSAAKLGLKCHIYCDDDNAPAYEVAAAHTVGAYDDATALKAFAESVDVATVEFENVPAGALATVGASTAVYPPPKALEVSQDRLTEKRFAQDLGIAVAPHHNITSANDLKAAIKDLGTPALLKTRRLGYDGKGQVRISNDTDLEEAYASLNGAPALLEQFVDFKCEISIVAARGVNGDLACYDVSQNLHRNQVLAEARVPANVSQDISQEARRLVRSLAEALDYRGVLCVELFYCGEAAESPLVMNEFAPRVHNSGHWTLDACAVSQFENHIRAVAGWPLGDTARMCDAVMINLIGPDIEQWRELARDPATSVHLYGKKHARPGRKMGHFTRLSPRST